MQTFIRESIKTLTKKVSYMTYLYKIGELLQMIIIITLMIFCGCWNDALKAMCL